MANRSHQHDVRRFLKRTKRTQSWLAREVGISDGAISDILNGRRTPSLSLAVKLSATTRVPVERFARG